MRLALLIAAWPAVLAAQAPSDLRVERAEFAAWLASAPNSPLAAIYHQPLGRELALGAAAEDPVLRELPAGVLTEGAVQVRLRTGAGERVWPRHRAMPLGSWRLRVSGERGRAVVTVYGAPRPHAPPAWYDWTADAVAEGTIEPPAEPAARRMLGLDGVEVTAEFAGTFVAEVMGEAVRLPVWRLPEPGTDEAEATLFFRDATNGRTTYPAGRFLALRPLGGGRWRADFNRARNPFCAYNGVFQCPLPWPGNIIERAVEAGELYHAGEGSP